MFRKNWMDLRFWRWYWREEVPTDAKVVVALALCALLAVAGYFASGHLSGANAASSDGTYVLETTVTKVITVKQHGRTIVKRVPVVVRRLIIRSRTRTAFETVVDTRVVTAPGGVRYVTRKVVHLVPVVKQRIVKVHGKTTTLTETRLVPTVRTQTLTNVVTNEQTVTNQNTVVVNHTSTVTQTATQTETHTVTLPPQTVTDTRTETVVQTVTQPAQTVTVTEPAVTITVPAP
jgi:hypothetical protein